jgi:hypothetical protein
MDRHITRLLFAGSNRDRAHLLFAEVVRKLLRTVDDPATQPRAAAIVANRKVGCLRTWEA